MMDRLRGEDFISSLPTAKHRFSPVSVCHRSNVITMLLAGVGLRRRMVTHFHD